jgi:hypothetical protein
MSEKRNTNKRDLKWIERKISFPVPPKYVEVFTTAVSSPANEDQVKQVLTTIYEMWRLRPAAELLEVYETHSAWKDLATLLALVTVPALKPIRPSFLRRGRNPRNDQGSGLQGLPISAQDARWLVQAVNSRSPGTSIEGRCSWLKNNPSEANCPSDYLSRVEPSTMARHYSKARKVLHLLAE